MTCMCLQASLSGLQGKPKFWKKAMSLVYDAIHASARVSQSGPNPSTPSNAASSILAYRPFIFGDVASFLQGWTGWRTELDTILSQRGVSAVTPWSHARDRCKLASDECRPANYEGIAN